MKNDSVIQIKEIRSYGTYDTLGWWELNYMNL